MEWTRGKGRKGKKGTSVKEGEEKEDREASGQHRRRTLVDEEKGKKRSRNEKGKESKLRGKGREEVIEKGVRTDCV